MRFDAGALEAVAEQDRYANRREVGESIPVVIWNPLGWERKGDVTIAVQEPTGKPETFAWTENEESGKTRTPARLVERNNATRRNQGANS